MTAVPRALTLSSPAKINLFLEIVNRRPDGYHTLSTLFQEISLSDTLRARVHPGRAMTMSTDDPSLKTDDTNLVLRAAHAFQNRYPATPGLHFSLTKRIPIGAGLGGGSGNAATALRACEALSVPRDPKVVQSLAKKLGADVPFFLHGGLAAAGGVGDRLTTLCPSVRRTYSFVLVFPRIFSSTPAAYRALHFPLTKRRSRLRLTRALKAGALPGVWSAWIYNRLEDAVLPRLRPVALAKKALIQAGCLNALMSGSGSSVFGVLENAAHGRRVMARVRRESWDVWLVSSISTKVEQHGNLGNQGFTPR